MVGLSHIKKPFRFFKRLLQRRRAKPPLEPAQTIHFLTSIDALPNELLIDILDDVYASIWIISPAAHWHKLRQWLNLLHVCGRWRAILFAYPRFWMNVPLARKEQLVQHFLSRATVGPLSIYGDARSLSPKSWPPLQPYRPYIQAVELFLPVLCPNSFPICELLSLQLPMLKRLCIVLPDADDKSLDTLFQIWRVSTGVQHIILRRSPPSPSHTFHQPALELVGMAGMSKFFPGLFIFSLTRIVLVYPAKWECQLVVDRAHPHRPRCVALGLRELVIVDDYLSVATVLSHVSPLFLTYMDIVSHISSAETFLNVQSGIFSRLSEEDYCLVACMTPGVSKTRWSVALSVQDSECALLVRSNPLTHHTKLRVQFASEIGANRSQMLPLVIQDMLKILAFYNVIEITIDGDPHHTNAAVWAGLFHEFKQLEHLKLVGNGAWIAVWQALLRPDPLVWRRGAFCCTTLKSVRVEYRLRPEENHPASPDEDAVEVLHEMLQVRSAAGHRLEELVWAAQSSRHADYDEARERFLQRLAPLVDRLVYEDLDRARPSGALASVGTIAS
ncbi:hypothetical protein C8Q70DRAFT_1058525 [Cubamyces menziesii]|nr:hypothetical protein C8Q70DRAFT_1058525 [Cubamyces menziesii]